jgi:hypothetical protein
MLTDVGGRPHFVRSGKVIRALFGYRYRHDSRAGPQPVRESEVKRVRPHVIAQAVAGDLASRHMPVHY